MKYRINSTVSHSGRRFLSTKLRREIDIKIVEVGPREYETVILLLRLVYRITAHLNHGQYLYNR